MPSLGEAPSGGARALGYLGLFQVTRRKGETISRRYRRNGYVHLQKLRRATHSFREQARSHNKTLNILNKRSPFADDQPSPNPNTT